MNGINTTALADFAARWDSYPALAGAAAPCLAAADQAASLDRLDAEPGNLRAAIAFTLTQPDLIPGLRPASSLPAYWRARGHGAEGASLLQALPDAPATQETTLPCARTLAPAAYLLRMGGYAIAEHYCQEALATAGAAGSDYLAGELLYRRAWVLLRQGQQHSALTLIEAGLDLARHLGEPRLTARLLSARAHATCVAGDHAGAVRATAEALRLFRQAGDRLQVGQVLGNLGYYELSAGDLDAARRHLTESLDIFRALGHRDGIAYQTLNLGLAEYLSGSPGPAGALFAESLDLARLRGMKALMAYALIGLALTDPGATAEPLEARLARPDRQRPRAAMGAEALDAEHAAGRTLDPAGGLAAPGPADTAAGQPQAAVPGEAATVLTARELDVLKLVAQGLTNPDIAQRLFLSQHTVHRHLANILRKLGLSSRAAAAAWGARTGLA